MTYYSVGLGIANMTRPFYVYGRAREERNQYYHWTQECADFLYGFVEYFMEALFRFDYSLLLLANPGNRGKIDSQKYESVYQEILNNFTFTASGVTIKNSSQVFEQVPIYEVIWLVMRVMQSVYISNNNYNITEWELNKYIQKELSYSCSIHWLDTPGAEIALEILSEDWEKIDTLTLRIVRTNGKREENFVPVSLDNVES